MRTLTIYQAVANGYDKPKPIKSIFPLVDYTCIVGMLGENVSPVLWNRYHKIKAPPSQSDVSLYLDGNITPRVGIGDLCVQLQTWLADADMALFKHPQRKCAYVEIEACVGRGKITHKQADIALEKLTEIGLPRDYGLFACGIIARRSNVQWLKMVQDRWWDLCQLVPRDQLWLTAVLWMTQRDRPAGRLRTIDLDIFKNHLFTVEPHKR